MQRITFEIDNNRDLKLLISIAEKLGISKFLFSPEIKPKLSDRDKLLKTIDKGADISSFGNVEDWQTANRTDRTLNL